MAPKENEKPKIIRVFEIEDYEKLLKGLQVAACMITQSHQIVDEASVLKRLNALTINGASDGNACSCCGVGPFETRAEQISHYKQHWHTHNLKRKLFGKPPLSLGQFNTREDDSSVSGSDSEEESGPQSKPVSDLFAAATRHCKAFYTNQAGQVFCIYRCILHHKKEELSTDGHGAAWTERCRRLAVPVFQRWAVLMVSGGHFAGAVFSGSVPVVHKTLHTYTTRRGQGHAQLVRDAHGNVSKSAGSNLRRYNQAQFLEHVQEILTTWQKDLTECSLVLYRALGPVNQAALFGKGSPLRRDEPRVRALPFPTKRPTYKEVRRVHDTVACVEVYDTMELFQKALIESTSKTITKSDAGIDRTKKLTKNSSKQIDRAKSRERAPRELPVQVTSSEDEGPCYIDSETPAGWIKTLSEQISNGVITNSRKDLLINDSSIACAHSSDSEGDENKRQADKNLSKKKQPDSKPAKKCQTKISPKIKKMWKIIADKEEERLGPILEEMGAEERRAACNAPDPADGNTALHKAALADLPRMVTQLLSAGGDPCVKNFALQTPYAASPHQDARVAFRLFQADHPDMYNYAKSQIPGPLTPELLEQERERKAQQKRAKRQRDKEKQMQKNKINKFLQMTDAEKVQANEPHCFLCGAKLPKRPFEYEKYRFCSIRCLQNHRNLRPLHKSA